jgi:anion-transporting  ArsA/GET3 family ATPase
VLVTSPRRDAVDEAQFFATKLAESDMPVDALIVNRVHPRFGDEQPEGLRARAMTLAAGGGDAGSDRAGATTRLAALYSNLADFQEISDRERRQFEGVRDRIEHATVAYVPFLARDVYDFDALSEVGGYLFALDDPPVAVAH